MNRFISCTLALVLAFPTVAVAQHQSERDVQDDRAEQSERTNQRNQSSTSRQNSETAHKFAKGERFERSRAQNYSRIDYRRYSRLSAAPRGYTWVRAGNDALLVRLRNNVVDRVVDGVFR